LFHLHFRELLLHAAAPEDLFCPVYVLIPVHLHLIWMGLRVDSDQRIAMKFLRKHLAVELARRSPGGVEIEPQKQSHDSVLREKDRLRGAFEKSCFYILDNPCRKKLVSHRRHGRIWARSCQAIRFCIRWPKISGSSSGRSIKRNGRQCARSGFR
jgi:hypothetical protein